MIGNDLALKQSWKTLTFQDEEGFIEQLERVYYFTSLKYIQIFEAKI